MDDAREKKITQLTLCPLSDELTKIRVPIRVTIRALVRSLILIDLVVTWPFRNA